MSKFIVFTNLWKNFVYLFAKCEFVIGQFPQAFVILFLSTSLCFFNRSHSRSKWSAVCGLILQRHVGSSIILNLWKYVLSLPCPVEVMKQYQNKVSNRFAALENLSCSKIIHINRAWENIKDHIRTSAKESLCPYELKQHKPWFDECFMIFRSKDAG